MTFKTGQEFITRNEKKAIVIKPIKDGFIAYVEGEGVVYEYDNEGNNIHPNERRHDIMERLSDWANDRKLPDVKT